MEEQAKSTRTMKIVLVVVIGIVVVAGILSALFYTPNGECKQDESNNNTEMSSSEPVNKEAAPF